MPPPNAAPLHSLASLISFSGFASGEAKILPPWPSVPPW